MVTEESKQKGYETSDAPTPPAVVGLVILVALMFLGFIGGKIFEDVFEATEVKTRPAAEPLAKRETVDGPLLQAHPQVELDAYLDSEQRKLSSYGWVDQSAGVVRIPIERAMELIVRDGLPRWEPMVAKLPEPAAGEEEKPDAEGDSGLSEGSKPGVGTPKDEPFTGTESIPE